MEKNSTKPVLLISDNESIQNKLIDVFLKLNLNSFIANSNEDAIDQLKQNSNFFCVMADLSSPLIFSDFPEVLKLIESQNITNIILCGESDIKMIRKVFKANDFAFLDITLAEKFLCENILHLLNLADIINNLKARECELSKSEKDLALTLKSIGDAVITTDAKGKVVRMNPIAEKLCGWKETKARGRDLSEVFVIKSSITGKIAENPVKKVIEKGRVVGLANHTSLTSRKGEVFQIADSAAPIKNNNGEIIGVVMVFTDVTKEYALQKRITDSEKKFRELFNSTLDGIALHDIIFENGKPVDYIITDVNPNYSKFTGIPAKNVIGKKGSEVYNPPDGKAPYLKEFTSVLKTGKPLNFESFYEPLNRFFDIAVFSPEEGKFATVFQDITKRKLAEKALMESEEKFKSLIKNYPAGIIVLYDKKYRYTLVEGAGLRASGFSKRMLLGKRIDEVFSNEFFYVIKPHIDRAFKGQKTTFEIEWNNQIFTQVVLPIRKNDEVVSVMGVVTNITLRRKTEIEIKLAEKRATIQRSAIARIVLNKSVIDAEIDEALRFIIKTAGKALHVSRASAWLLEDNNTKLISKSLFDVGTKTFLKSNVLLAENYPKYFKAILSQSRINADDAENDARTAEFTTSYLKPLGIKSMLDAGIMHDGKTIGVVCFEQQYEYRQWYSDEESFAGTIAAIVSQLFANLERKKTEKELIQAKEKAEQSDRLKTLFLQNISHEIRTPLNGIIGFCSLLKDFKDMDKVEKNNYINMVLYSSERLLGVVTDIIEMAKIDSGVSVVNESEFELKMLLDYFREMLVQGAESKYLQSKVFVSPTIEKMMIRSDKDKLSQIISNLINNAVKFTEKGFVQLSVKPVSKGIEICVKDSGVGIEKKYFDLIFERFWQHETFSKSNYGGTGLGLSITKGLTSTLGLELKFNSKPGVGSSFKIIIPANCVSKPEKTKLVSPKIKADTKDLKSSSKTLIVEDDTINNYYLLNIFKKAKISADTAENGQVAVELVRKKKYDLILMDIKMPVMDGIEASRIIKRIQPDAVIIAQSAYTQPEEIQKTSEAGCSGFVQKPLKRQEIISLIEKYLLKKK